MEKGLLFWIVYLICLLFGGWIGWSSSDRRWIGGGVIFFVLAGLLGWAVFGAPIH